MSYAFAPGLQAGGLPAAGGRRGARRRWSAARSTTRRSGWPGRRGAGLRDARRGERCGPNGTKTSDGAIHDFAVTVHSARDGFERGEADRRGGLRRLIDAPLALDAGRLVALRFLRARAERGPAPEKRKVTLRFRAVVDQDD